MRRKTHRITTILKLRQANLRAIVTCAGPIDRAHRDRSDASRHCRQSDGAIWPFGGRRSRQFCSSATCGGIDLCRLLRPGRPHPGRSRAMTSHHKRVVRSGGRSSVARPLRSTLLGAVAAEEPAQSGGSRGAAVHPAKPNAWNAQIKQACVSARDTRPDDAEAQEGPISDFKAS
jgi:hypothetical protein